jgi:hypothetical protein
MDSNLELKSKLSGCHFRQERQSSGGLKHARGYEDWRIFFERPHTGASAARQWFAWLLTAGRVCQYCLLAIIRFPRSTPMLRVSRGEVLPELSTWAGLARDSIHPSQTSAARSLRTALCETARGLHNQITSPARSSAALKCCPAQPAPANCSGCTVRCRC